MEKLNIDSDTTCPCCGKPRYFLKFYYEKTFLRCEDCGYHELI